MAYDQNDPADVAIVNKAVRDALAKQAREHEAEIEGLTEKRDELLGKLKKARQGGSGEPSAEVERLEGEVSRLEGEIKTLKRDLRKATDDLATVTGERDAAVTERDTERTTARDLFVKGELTTALNGVNVASDYHEGLIAVMGKKVEVKEVNGERKAFVGNKPLGEFVKEWSQGDQAKAYVSAGSNGGGGAHSTQSPQGGKSKPLAEMSEKERIELATADPMAFAALVEADKQARNRPKV